MIRQGSSGVAMDGLDASLRRAYFAPAYDFALGLVGDVQPSLFPPLGLPLPATSLMSHPMDDPSLLGPPLLPPDPAWGLGVVDANPHQPPLPSLPSGVKRKRSPGTVGALASSQAWLNASWMPAVSATWPGPWPSPAPGPPPSLRDGLETEMPMPLPMPASLPMPPQHEAQPPAWLPAESAILTCQSCSTSWQRQDLPPPPAGAASRASPAPMAFLCRACELSRAEDGPSSADAAAPDRRLAVERLRQRCLSALPPTATPAKPELVGFVESQASDAEVRSHGGP